MIKLLRIMLLELSVLLQMQGSHDQMKGTFSHCRVGFMLSGKEDGETVSKPFRYEPCDRLGRTAFHEPLVCSEKR